MNIQSTGLKRSTIDKFYTIDSVAKQCVEWFVSIQLPTHNDIVIEPSAGAGVFLPHLCVLDSTIKAYDIAPEESSIQQQDFLLLNTTLFSPYENIFVVGNPPFGKNSTLARKFIKKTCTFASMFAFILPLSFKKQSLQQSIPRTFHLVFERDLDENSFEVNGKSYNVPCVFQIWKRETHIRPLVNKEQVNHNHYVFCKKTEHPHIALRRVGVNAGDCFISNLESKSPQSHYFLQLKTLTPTEFVTKYSQLAFDGASHTVGPKSISKQEFIQQLNQLFL